MKAQKIIELQNSEFGFKGSNVKQRGRLVDYLQAISAEKKQSLSNFTAYDVLIRHIKQKVQKNR